MPEGEAQRFTMLETGNVDALEISRRLIAHQFDLRAHIVI